MGSLVIMPTRPATFPVAAFAASDAPTVAAFTSAL